MAASEAGVVDGEEPSRAEQDVAIDISPLTAESNLSQLARLESALLRDGPVDPDEYAAVRDRLVQASGLPSDPGGLAGHPRRPDQASAMGYAEAPVEGEVGLVRRG